MKISTQKNQKKARNTRTISTYFRSSHITTAHTLHNSHIIVAHTLHNSHITMTRKFSTYFTKAVYTYLIVAFYKTVTGVEQKKNTSQPQPQDTQKIKICQ
ncbi:hypothetical protein V6Z11_A06G045600 [Gossypium hirsutum]